MRLKQHLITEGAARGGNTALQESLFGAGYAISQVTRGSITPQMMADANLFDQAYSLYFRGTLNSDKVYQFGMSNPDWITSVVRSVNELRKTPQLKSKYRIYRGVGIMSNIYKQKEVLAKKAGISIKDDKWNPGDVWMTTMSNIPTFGDIYELNEFISVKLKTGELVSVSLKKTGNSGKVYYIEQGDSAVSSHGYKGIKRPRSPFNIGVVILLDHASYTLDVRSFDTPTVKPVYGELQVKGSKASHGKVNVIPIVKSYGAHITSLSEIKRMVDVEDPESLKILSNKVVDMWSKLGHDWSQDKVDSMWATKNRSKYNKLGYFYSIINSLEVAIFLDGASGKADEIVTEFVKQAKSTNDISSDHLKIY